MPGPSLLSAIAEEPPTIIARFDPGRSEHPASPAPRSARGFEPSYGEEGAMLDNDSDSGVGGAPWAHRPRRAGSLRRGLEKLVVKTEHALAQLPARPVMLARHRSQTPSRGRGESGAPPGPKQDGALASAPEVKVRLGELELDGELTSTRLDHSTPRSSVGSECEFEKLTTADFALIESEALTASIEILGDKEADHASQSPTADNPGDERSVELSAAQPLRRVQPLRRAQVRVRAQAQVQPLLDSDLELQDEPILLHQSVAKRGSSVTSGTPAKVLTA